MEKTHFDPLYDQPLTVAVGRRNRKNSYQVHILVLLLVDFAWCVRENKKTTHVYAGLYVRPYTQNCIQVCSQDHTQMLRIKYVEAFLSVSPTCL